METYDIGSMPLDGSYEKLMEGATQLYSLSHMKEERTYESVEYFEGKVVKGFLDKVKAGIDIPNYPQFRGMVEMFFEMIDGLEKLNEGYVEVEELSLKGGRLEIPEVLVIRRKSKEIHEYCEKAFRVKVCITGPYTLASSFAYRDPQLYLRLGEVLSRIVEGNIFNNKYGRVDLLALDEPVFGMIDDPTIDRGTEGRENLLKAWEKILHKAVTKNVSTCMHLHSTSDSLFWDVESLKIVESHVDDPLYFSKRTKNLLESRDKFLKASICLSNFDELIKRSVSTAVREAENITERIGEVWKDLKRGRKDPNAFLESVDSMRERLIEVVERFGLERVVYAGPECGLSSFPTYESAVEYLRRVSKAAKSVSKKGGKEI